MSQLNFKETLDSLKNYMGVNELANCTFGGVDYFLPLLEKMRKDSSVVIIKLDGEREENIYTFVVSGVALGYEGSIRLDTSNFTDGMTYICFEYAKRVWGWTTNSNL